MTEFDFPQEMPRPTKRQTEDVVLPPDESMLSADDLLLGIPEPMISAAPAEQAHENSDDLLMELPPEAMVDDQVEQPPIEPAVLDAQTEEAAQPASKSDDSLELSIQFDTDEPHEMSMPTGDGAVRLGVVDQQQLEASESDSDIADLPPSTAGEEKPQGFVEKHKSKLVIVAVVLGLIGMKMYQDGKKAELAATAVPPIDPATTQVQSAALEDMQKGELYVSPLPAGSDELVGDDPAVDAILGGDLASQPVDPLLPPVEQAPVQTVEPMAAAAPVASTEAANPVAPIAPAEPTVTEAPVAPATEQAPLQPAGQPVVPVAAAAKTVSGDEVAKLKADLARAEARLKEAEAEIARLKAGAAKPQSSASQLVAKASAAKPHRETRVISTAKKQSQPSRPAASAKRSDIQYIGSFLSGSNWGAHVVIAGNLYELSAGQRIANLKVDSVTGSGVTINGVNYR